MKERPILFSAPMVRAILDGRKTQTRRIVKPQPYLRPWQAANGEVDDAVFWRFGEEREDWPSAATCPYGAPGDRLWVREAWNVRGLAWGKKPSEAAKIASRDAWLYRASDDGSWQHGWKPGIHMPRAASRITLEVTDVRVERLQAISEEDALAEGLALPALIQPGHAAGCFSRLWDEINGERAPWSSNPWVWVVAFRRVAAGQPEATLAQEAAHG